MRSRWMGWGWVGVLLCGVVLVLVQCGVVHVHFGVGVVFVHFGVGSYLCTVVWGLCSCTDGVGVVLVHCGVGGGLGGAGMRTCNSRLLLMGRVGADKAQGFYSTSYPLVCPLVSQDNFFGTVS